MTPEEIADLRQKRYNATVLQLLKPHSDLMFLRVRPDFPLRPHLPGQYANLGLGYWEPRAPDCQDEEVPEAERTKVVRRAYSIGCPVLDEKGELLAEYGKEWLEFYIVLVRSSDKEKPPALTPRLFMLKEGDRLMMGEKITGHFTAEHVKPTDTVLFLSTGTGEAPHNYMMWELLRRGHEGRILGACCVRYGKDLAYLAVHQELMRRYPRYTYVSLTTREATTVGQKVYIQDLLSSGQLEERLGEALEPARTHVFLCGNPLMIGVPNKDRETGVRSYPKPTGVIELLEQRGFQCDQPNVKLVGNIHYEEYW